MRRVLMALVLCVLLGGSSAIADGGGESPAEAWPSPIGRYDLCEFGILKQELADLYNRQYANVTLIYGLPMRNETGWREYLWGQEYTFRPGAWTATEWIWAWDKTPGTRFAYYHSWNCEAGECINYPTGIPAEVRAMVASQFDQDLARVMMEIAAQ